MNKWVKDNLLFGWAGPLVLLLVAVFLVGGMRAAFAGEATLSWSKPTGSEVCQSQPPVPDLTGYNVWRLIDTIDDPDIETWSESGLKPGTYTYAMTALTANAESKLSHGVEKEVTEFKALAGAQAYQPVMIASGWWMVPMATMDADTQCDVTQSANGYYRVPPGSYTWLDGSTARPVMLVAECG